MFKSDEILTNNVLANFLVITFVASMSFSCQAYAVSNDIENEYTIVGTGGKEDNHLKNLWGNIEDIIKIIQVSWPGIN